LITKSKRGQDQVHFQSSTNKIIAAFLLKIEKIMKFCWFFKFWFSFKQISPVSKIFDLTRRFVSFSVYSWLDELLGVSANPAHPSVHAKIKSDLEWAGFSRNFLLFSWETKND
jgi:hypothetical protein